MRQQYLLGRQERRRTAAGLLDEFEVSAHQDSFLPRKDLA